MLYDSKMDMGMTLAERVGILAKRAKQLFGWIPREGFFENGDLEPANDSGADLIKAIAENVGQDDVVLTTPTHIPLFATKSPNITAYDISPNQLDNFGSGAIEKYWCDVFHSDILKKLLDTVNPTIFYLSNIPEWADGDQNVRSEQFAELINVLRDQPTLKKVMFSSYIYDLEGHSGPSVELAKMFDDNDWVINEYQEDPKVFQKIFVASR